MDTDIILEYQEELQPEDARTLFEGVVEEAYKKKVMERMKPFGIFLKNSSGQVLGGTTCLICYGCLYIDQLWVAEEERGKHAGCTLIQEAEKIGRKNSCSFATVNTMDWEALTFYQKLGYFVEFVRDGYDNDSTMYLLRKPL